jgi:nucleotide-binding universal stress UspA family protein
MLLQLAGTADLVVVGSHGRGGFSGMRLGSVARRLVHHAQAPVLVVRTKGVAQVGPGTA